MTVRVLIELKAPPPPGVGPLYYYQGATGFLGWTSVPQDAMSFDTLGDAQAYMQEGYLSGAAEAREHKFIELVGSRA